MDAVAKVEWPFKGHISGFPAWVTWLTVHIFFLIGFRNRLAVLATFTRGSRLITGDQRIPGWHDRVAAGPIPDRPTLSSQSFEQGKKAS
jgi:NADH dehydrogenase